MNEKHEEVDQYNPKRYVLSDKKDKIIFLGVLPAFLAVIFLSIIILFSSISNPKSTSNIPLWFLLAIGILLYFGMMATMIRAQHDIISFRKRRRGEKSKLDESEKIKTKKLLNKKDKKLLAIGIILLLIAIGVYAGYTINIWIEEDKFNGVWTVSEYNNGSFTMIWFWPSGTVNVRDLTKPNGTYISDYVIEFGNRLVIKAAMGHPERRFKYEFEGEDILYLTDEDSLITTKYIKYDLNE